jgi:hypothetical protein
MWPVDPRVGNVKYDDPSLIKPVELDAVVQRAHPRRALGPHVDEVINVFGLAIRHGLTAGSDVGYMV